MNKQTALHIAAALFLLALFCIAGTIDFQMI